MSLTFLGWRLADGQVRLAFSFKITANNMPILNKDINSMGLLPFKSQAEAWKYLRVLDAERKLILEQMHGLAEQFRHTFTQRELYLNIQQVQSGTIYIRWRKKGVNGANAYLVLTSDEGQAFLAAQTSAVQQIFLHFNKQTLDLNLAFSLRINEKRRIERYLNEWTHSRQCGRFKTDVVDEKPVPMEF